jgi:hypothetical protein
MIHTGGDEAPIVKRRHSRHNTRVAPQGSELSVGWNGAVNTQAAIQTARQQPVARQKANRGHNGAPMRCWEPVQEMWDGWCDMGLRSVWDGWCDMGLRSVWGGLRPRHKKEPRWMFTRRIVLVVVVVFFSLVSAWLAGFNMAALKYIG